MAKRIVNKRRFTTSVIVIFLIFLAVIFLFNKISGSSKADRTEEVKQEKEVIPDKSVRMTVTGDVLTHNTNYYDAYDSKTGDYDFSYVFEDVKEYIESADIAIGNLETTFAGKDRGYASYPTFNTPENLAKDLKEFGIR